MPITGVICGFAESVFKRELVIIFGAGAISLVLILFIHISSGYLLALINRGRVSRLEFARLGF